MPHYFTGTWLRGYGFFEVYQAERHMFESRPRPGFLCRFFRLCETFFANIFNVSKGSTLHFFSILLNGCSEAPKGPPFTFFRHYATYRRPKKIRTKISKTDFFSIFSSRGYCRREYLTLVSPFGIFEP